MGEIWSYVSERNLPAPDKLIDRIFEVALALADQPRAGRARSELGYDLRSFPVGEYLIFYRPLPDGIDMVRVLHAHRDIDADFF